MTPEQEQLARTRTEQCLSEVRQFVREAEKAALPVPQSLHDAMNALAECWKEPQ